MVIQYLESALFEHKVVVVPDLGAFVKDEVMAGATDGYLVPLRTVISFDPKLSNDPSVLTGHIAEGEGITIAEAENELRYFVAEVKYRLTEEVVFKLDGLGELRQDNKGVITFVPINDANFSADSYGLPSLAVDLPKVDPQVSYGSLTTSSESTVQSGSTTVDNTGNEPKKKGSALLIWVLILGCVVALTGILYLLNQKKAMDAGVKEDEEGVVFNRKGKPSHQDEVVTELPESTTEAPTEPSHESAAEPAKTTTPADKPASEPKSAPVPAAAPSPTKATAASKSNKSAEPVFNVIVGSFGVPENAYNLSKSLAAEGLETHVLDPSGSSKLYKVSIGQFDTEAEAAAFIKEKQRNFKEKLFLLKP